MFGSAAMPCAAAFSRATQFHTGQRDRQLDQRRYLLQHFGVLGKQRQPRQQVPARQQSDLRHRHQANTERRPVGQDNQQPAAQRLPRRSVSKARMQHMHCPRLRTLAWARMVGGSSCIASSSCATRRPAYLDCQSRAGQGRVVIQCACGTREGGRKERGSLTELGPPCSQLTCT